MTPHNPGFQFEETLPELWTIIKNLLSLSNKNVPFIIGIGGSAGVGKSTFASSLGQFLANKGQKNILLSIDDFFKNPTERKELSEWGPQHVRIQEIRRILQLIKTGQKLIRTKRYKRKAIKEFSSWEISLRGIDLVIFEGIYAINDSKHLGKFSDFMDLAIYLKASLENIKCWRFQQEYQKPRGRNQEEMEKHWREGILPDFYHNIAPTEDNADIVIQVDSEHLSKIVKIKSR